MLKQSLILNLIFNLILNLNSHILPPIPELWTNEIHDQLYGIKEAEHWLKDYHFYAPLRVKPNESWNAYVEATWTGPSLVDRSLIPYVELVFTPLDSSHDNDWTGDKKLIVTHFDLKTNKIVFQPENNNTFMIAPGHKIGVYNNMYFTLAISNEKLPAMFVMINTRLHRDIEVTCSDGLFCNGEERFVNGKCLSSKFKPCEDLTHDPCKSYECIEAEQQCSMTPLGGDNCKKCNSPKINIADKCFELEYECGWSKDLTFFCGTCPSNEYVCSKHKCILRSSLGEGSCNRPYQLYNESLVIPTQGIQDYIIYGDLSLPIYTDNAVPICNPAPVVDVVYEFIIQSPVLMGIEVQMLKADGSNDRMDTVLALHDSACHPLQLYSFCGDDSSPPGGVSSRIFGKLANGTYKLIATAFSDVPENIRPYQLKVKFYPDCLPQCDGNRKCGDDGCGGVCGVCSDDKQCDLETGQCRLSPCIPDCIHKSKNNVSYIKECGDDGCAGVCGICDTRNSEMCVSQIGKCKRVHLCDHLRPECIKPIPEHMEYPYCAHDCEWHDMKEQLGDLMPNDDKLVLPTIEFDWRIIGNRSCAIVEGCLKHQGKRLLMRFDTYVHNVGRNIFYPPIPDDAPNQFEWSPCHAHYHFEGFALFNLYDMNSKIAVTGGKRGYCMEDTVQTMFGEHIPCKNLFACTKQGIQPGWADLYPNVLDCQWLDITDIEKEKWYIYEICTNVERKLVEAAYANNCKRFPVYIPYIEFMLSDASIKYDDILQERNIKHIPQIVQEPGSELANHPKENLLNKENDKKNRLLNNIIDYFLKYFN